MDKFQVEKLRVAAESKSAECAATVESLGHEHPKSKEAKKASVNAGEAYRLALVG